MLNPTLDGIQKYLLWTGVGRFSPPLLKASRGHFWGQMDNKPKWVSKYEVLAFRKKNFLKGVPKFFFEKIFFFFKMAVFFK